MNVLILLCLLSAPGDAREDLDAALMMLETGNRDAAMERIDESPIRRLLVTDSIETQPVTFSPKVEVVSVAPLFGEAIRRIHNRESISVLFPA